MSEDSTKAPDPAAQDAPEPTGLRQPWIRFSLLFGAIAGVAEIFYHAVALEADAFFTFLVGLANATAFVLEPFYDRVRVTGARVATEKFVVTVNYGCDGLQVCTLLTSAVLAFPATWKQKLTGIVVGNLWLQAWNVTRIATLVVIGGISREAFDPVHVYIWPAILIGVCLVAWMYWARWTMSHGQLAAGP